MSASGEAFSLSVAEIDILAERLGIGAWMFPIEVPSVGATDAERREIGARAWRDLTARGLVRRDRPEPAVEDALRMLARPTTAVSALALLAKGRVLRARGAGNGRAAVVADQDDDRVRIEFVSPDQMLPLVVDLIGLARPGPGAPFTIPAPGDGDGKVTEAFDPRGDARRAAAEAVLQQRRLRAGVFTAHGTDRRGNPCHSAELDWFDTAKGRYAVHATATGRLTCAPADNPILAHYLGRLADGLAAA